MFIASAPVLKKGHRKEVKEELNFLTICGTVGPRYSQTFYPRIFEVHKNTPKFSMCSPSLSLFAILRMNFA